MKQTILIICILLFVSSCSQTTVEENDIDKYNKFHQQKQMMSKKYFDLMQSPEKNKRELQKYDQKIHEINKNLKQLSMKEHVRDYLRIQFLEKQVDANENGESSTSLKDSESEFDYYVDNVNVDADYDFSNKDFVETTNENDSFGDDNEDDTSLNTDEYIEPDEGFSPKDIDNSGSGEEDSTQMESSEVDNIDEEYEFEDFDEKNE